MDMWRKWFDDLSSFLMQRGYESVLTNDSKLIVFGPKEFDKETAERIKWTKPGSVECELRIGLLQSTLLVLEKEQARLGRIQIRDDKGSVTIILDPRLAEATEEYELLNAFDTLMARDKYPWRYTIKLGEKSWDRYPRLVSDFADHNHRVDEADLRIALETAKSMEEFLAMV